MLLAYDTVMMPSPKFIGALYRENSQMTWDELFWIKLEVMETRKDLGDKMTGLVELAFPNLDIWEYGAIKALLADAFMDANRNDNIRGYVVKGGPCRQTEALEVAENSEMIWETNWDQRTQRSQGWKDTRKSAIKR